MEFRLLGPVEVAIGDHLVDTGRPRQQAVLAVLLADVGRLVSTELLIDRVWGDEAPPSARRTLHVHLSRVRQLLKQDRAQRVSLAYRSGGYVLDVDPQMVDLHRFRRSIADARGVECSDIGRAERLRDALDLWRGEPLAGLSGDWVTRTRQSWSQQYLDAVIAWADAELSLGNTDATIGPLTALSADHPLMEPLTAVLMRALHAAGRSGAAMEHFAALRERLADQLGADPGAQIRAVHEAILRDDDTAVIPTRPRAATFPPAQLPTDVAAFTGRDSDLDRLDAPLTGGHRRAPGAAVIFVISGMAGVGKTALAVHWAHRVAYRFPDGQLYVNLRGFDPAGRVMAPAEAVRGFLDALDVPAERIPHDLDAQVGLYRSRLAGRRMLVVLDNARDAEQVRPLLPGTGTAVVVVTSRDRLTGLVATTAAHPLDLDLLSRAEARRLLASRLGQPRVAAEPDAVEVIVTACARLPLALAIAAARALHTRTSFPLAAIAAELTETGRRLDALDAGDTASRLRGVFSWSYTGLAPAAARLFRLLGLYPGPDISVAAAASLAGEQPAPVRRLMAELLHANLLTEQQPGRYVSHDLLRAYASELADDLEPLPDRESALNRLLSYYTHTAHLAGQLCLPAHSPSVVPLTAPAADSQTEHLSDRGAAIRWLNTERPALLAAVPCAADHGLHTHSWLLAKNLHVFLWVHGYKRDLPAVWRVAAAAAARLGDLLAQGYAHLMLAHSESALGRYDEAKVHFQHALDLYGQAGDTTRQAETYRYMAHMYAFQEDYDQALAVAQEALRLFRTANHDRGEALALTAIGEFRTLRGDHRQAIVHSEQALVIHRQIGDQNAEANDLDTLGSAHHHLGEYGKAVDCYQRAVTIFGVIGNLNDEAETLERLGDTQHAAGQLDAACDAWRRALNIFVQVGHSREKDVRGKLENAGEAG